MLVMRLVLPGHVTFFIRVDVDVVLMRAQCEGTRKLALHVPREHIFVLQEHTFVLHGDTYLYSMGTHICSMEHIFVLCGVQIGVPAEYRYVSQNSRDVQIDRNKQTWRFTQSLQLEKFVTSPYAQNHRTGAYN